jgi:hypothetical protein
MKHFVLSKFKGWFKQDFGLFTVWCRQMLLIVHIGWFMVFNATLNNISVISWQSVLLVEETKIFNCFNLASMSKMFANFTY